MFYHTIAVLPGDRKKSIVNKTETQVLTDIIIPYVSIGIISAKWGDKTQSYQVLELRIYKTTEPWNKVAGQKLEAFLSKKPNLFQKFRQRAEKALGKAALRVFVIMPIQGEKYGSQDEQRIFKEYDERFKAIEQVMANYPCVAIRIYKEHPLEDLVARIKNEIDRAQFVIADLTDERPSCYYEAGYAEAKRKPTIYVASKESVITPGKPTKIHFDVHMNVYFFTNHNELMEKVIAAIEKNKERLFKKEKEEESLISVVTVPTEVTIS